MTSHDPADTPPAEPEGADLPPADTTADTTNDDPPRADEPPALPEPPHPINWATLTADRAATEWLRLDAWVRWLRTTYGLPPTIIPPLWHRHPELVWELSALHLHWLNAYDPEQHGSAPMGWHTDFAAARDRLREWVALSGTKLDRDRPTQRPTWPGEPPAPDTNDTTITDRQADFDQFVQDDLDHRRHQA